MVKLDTSLDYASHELEAKRLLKEIHGLLLDKDYVVAASTIDIVIVELRLMRTAVKSHIQDA